MPLLDVNTPYFGVAAHPMAIRFWKSESQQAGLSRTLEGVGAELKQLVLNAARHSRTPHLSTHRDTKRGRLCGPYAMVPSPCEVDRATRAHVVLSVRFLIATAPLPKKMPQSPYTDSLTAV